jgi:hypothetical protein
MGNTALRMAVVVGFVAFSCAGIAYTRQAQEQDHAHVSAHHDAAQYSGNDNDTAIFCPTMKTGQLCTEGTTNILGLKGDQQKEWVELARKYNHSVDAATLQLFKDSEGLLNPDQQRLLKAWFAVGLNPQINQLLYGKGLGPQKH